MIFYSIYYLYHIFCTICANNKPWYQCLLFVCILLLAFSFWIVLQLNCNIYFWELVLLLWVMYSALLYSPLLLFVPLWLVTFISESRCSFFGWCTVHCCTVLYFSLCLYGLYTMEKVSKCKLKELMKASALKCWNSNVCIILFYDLKQIPYDHTVEVRNRFKGLDLIDRVPDELWTEVRDIVQETGVKTIQEKEMQKSKMAEEAL